MKRLHKVNDILKKYAHVNKKAFEQYQNFTKQRDELLARREELDTSAESIQELIETLDQRKDEAIERTFKQVSKYFEEVFETLVPDGRGLLVMQKRIPGQTVSGFRCLVPDQHSFNCRRKRRKSREMSIGLRIDQRARSTTIPESQLRFPSTQSRTRDKGYSSYQEGRNR